MINIQELTDKIRTWAIVKGLDSANPDKQVMKLGEEFGEVCAAMSKNHDLEELEKEIGDMFVVMTILATQKGSSIERCVAFAYEKIKDRKGKMVNGVFVKESDL